MDKNLKKSWIIQGKKKEMSFKGLLAKKSLFIPDENSSKTKIKWTSAEIAERGVLV